MSKCGATGDKLDKLKVDTCSGILQAIRTVKAAKPDDAITIHQIISECLPSASVELIMDSLNTKVNLAGTTVTGVVIPEKQSNKCLDIYLTEEAWSKFLDTNGDPQTKLMAMAMFFVLIGLKNPDENTFARGAALALQTEPYNVTKLIEDTRNFKLLVKSTTESSPQMLVGPKEYPDDLAAFQQMCPDVHKQAFESSPPAPTRWTPQHRAMVEQMKVCRSSKNGCDQHVVAPARASKGQGQMRQFMASPSLIAPRSLLPGAVASPTAIQAYTAPQLANGSAQGVAVSLAEPPPGLQLAPPASFPGGAPGPVGAHPGSVGASVPVGAVPGRPGPVGAHPVPGGALVPVVAPPCAVDAPAAAVLAVAPPSMQAVTELIKQKLKGKGGAVDVDGTEAASGNEEEDEIC